ncbi:MAG: CBS domain-containing protein [Candidatus Dormibacter sp.]|uniref:CBS domain-containing protein n=1 Tax=Candidatus Dormibacter sp. TaxID=2973982 RepID=UPI000DB171A6|nr:MAG: CBS domain-containing protein [Candidatus Dormibacteraeota bacterium]
MSRTVKDVMTEKPLALQAGTTLVEAALAMRNHDVGNVLLLDNDTVVGIVTDRDIVIRSVAEGQDPGQTVLAQISSRDLTSLRMDQPVEEAVKLMEERAVRRLPVLDEAGRPLGIVSIGDLAVERDPSSALGQISEAEPNR